jgi:UDP-galactopyranose mutase
MAPSSSSSVCIETTITQYMAKRGIRYLVEKSIEQFQHLYHLSSSEIKYLGYEIVENAYPIIYVNYKGRVDEMVNNLLLKKGVYLLGRTGHYEYIGIQKILEDTMKVTEELSEAR